MHNGHKENLHCANVWRASLTRDRINLLYMAGVSDACLALTKNISPKTVSPFQYFLINVKSSFQTMSEKYKIRENDKAYFVTLTVVDWIDIFTRKVYKIKIVKSLKYCQMYKGLEIYAWCLMSNHLHMIVKAGNTQTLSEILRDFKKFTARVILLEIQDQSESRREWILERFMDTGKCVKRVEKYKFWQDGNHPELISCPKIFYQKLKYIHQNPVKEMIVENPVDYLFSSARNYAGMSNILPVILETPELITYK